MTRRRKVIWLAAVVLAIVGGGGAVIASRQSQAPKIDDRPPLEFARSDVVNLQPKRLAVELAVAGSLQAVSQATVRSKLSAEVKRVLVREGDKVSAGQVVAEFDTAQLRALLAERTASYEFAKAQLANTERTRQVNAQLVKQNFISQNAFDTADSANQAQLAAVQASRAQVEQTQIQLNDSIVRAPISGIVAKRHVQPGEKLAFDAPLMAIVDLTRARSPGAGSGVRRAADPQGNAGVGRHRRHPRTGLRRPRRAHQSKHRAGHAHRQHLRLAAE